MTTLQKIVTAAKKLKKQYPNKYPKWTDYIKAASKDIKKPGKKIADVNVTYRSKKEADYLVERKKNGRFKGTVRLAGVKKKPEAKKKPATVTKHTDKGSHNTNIKVVSGVMDASKFHLNMVNNILRQIEHYEILIHKSKESLKTPYGKENKIAINTKIKNLKKSVIDLKKSITLHKKSIK
jgi:hypothetical protein